MTYSAFEKWKDAAIECEFCGVLFAPPESGPTTCAEHFTETGPPTPLAEIADSINELRIRVSTGFSVLYAVIERLTGDTPTYNNELAPSAEIAGEYGSLRHEIALLNAAIDSIEWLVEHARTEL